MRIVRINKAFLVLVLLIAAICGIQPVLGNNGTVSIAYRGSGGSYIGDTVIFDGKNTVGTITFIRITGPGLPDEGVPIYDLNGVPGSGNTVEVNPDGTWKLAWYTSSIKGVEKMQTARYYLTAADLAHPEISSTTSVVMKKAEFYATLTPNPATLDEYVLLAGTAERGVSYVRIDVTDMSGKILRTFTSPVSASGYFNYGFHVDMQPGDYYITVSNPALKNPLRMTLSVISPRIKNPQETMVVVIPGEPAASIQDTPSPLAAGLQNPPVTPAETGTLSVTSIPAGGFVYLDSVMVGKTPVELGNLTYGSHMVEIKTPGYLPYSVQVTVRPGEPATLSPVLLKSPSSIPLSPLIALTGLIIYGAVALAWRRR